MIFLQNKREVTVQASIVESRIEVNTTPRPKNAAARDKGW